MFDNEYPKDTIHYSSDLQIGGGNTGTIFSVPAGETWTLLRTAIYTDGASTNLIKHGTIEIQWSKTSGQYDSQLKLRKIPGGESVEYNNSAGNGLFEAWYVKRDINATTTQDEAYLSENFTSLCQTETYNGKTFERCYNNISDIAFPLIVVILFALFTHWIFKLFR